MAIHWKRGGLRVLTVVATVYTLVVLAIACGHWQRATEADRLAFGYAEKLGLDPYSARDRARFEQLATLPGPKLSAEDYAATDRYIKRRWAENDLNRANAESQRAGLAMTGTLQWLFPSVLLALCAIMLWIWRGFRPKAAA